MSEVAVAQHGTEPTSEERFDAFVAARGSALWRSAWLLTGDRHLAEDLVQTALAKAWPKWKAIADEGRFEASAAECTASARSRPTGVGDVRHVPAFRYCAPGVSGAGAALGGDDGLVLEQWGAGFLGATTQPEGHCASSRGGLPYLSLRDDWGNALINNTYKNNGFFGNPTNGDFEQLNLQNNEPTNCYRGNTNTSGKLSAGSAALQLQCVAVSQKFIEPTAAQRAAKQPSLGDVPPEKPHDMDIDNENSAAFVLSFGAFRFFDGGDLTWNLEPKLVSPINLVGPVDVYQTDHHGLDRSNNPLLIRGLAPTVAVMNNGPRKGNEAGAHATLKAQTTLQAFYQLHQTLMVDADRNTDPAFIANTDQSGGPKDGNYIKLSVAPDGKTYTITIPATGHSRTYQTKAK